MKCAAVICAAGAGSRMGQNKALCPLGNETFLSSIVRVLQSIKSPPVSPIVVVTGSQAESVRETHQHLTGILWAHNPDWASTHMLETLTCGLQQIPPGTHVLHWPVDCIGIEHEALRRLLNAPPEPYAVLSYHGKAGHPLRIRADQADILRSHDHPYTSLRDIFEIHPRLLVESSHSALMNCNDPQTLADFVASKHNL